MFSVKKMTKMFILSSCVNMYGQSLVSCTALFPHRANAKGACNLFMPVTKVGWRAGDWWTTCFTKLITDKSYIFILSSSQELDKQKLHLLKTASCSVKTLEWLKKVMHKHTKFALSLRNFFLFFYAGFRKFWSGPRSIISFAIVAHWSAYQVCF